MVNIKPHPTTPNISIMILSNKAGLAVDEIHNNNY